MATWTGSFELRRLLVKFSRTPSGGVSQDAAYMGFHFIKLTSGAPDSNWLTADYTAVETAFDTCWTAIKSKFAAVITHTGYVWYKDGPVWSPDDFANGPSNPAQRTTARSVVATAAGAAMPPQVALTVTEHVGIEKRRGRFYLPPPNGFGTTDGYYDIVSSGLLASIVAFYNTCRAGSRIPVVWSRGRSAHVTPAGTSLAAHPATAYEITELQIDNLYDVIRSRRYAAPTVRSRTTLT